ncbi:MAG: hypothetical protein ACKVOP_04475 [Sphingomonadaceae bacterium]
MTAPPKAAKPRQFAKPRIRKAPLQMASTPLCPDPVPVLLTDVPFDVPNASQAFVANTPGLADDLGTFADVRPGVPNIRPGLIGFTPPAFIPTPLPEAQTWVQMIAGFGAIGGAIRLSKRHQGEKAAPGSTVS